MTKAKQNLVTANIRQLSLFDLLSQERGQRAAERAGRLNISARIDAAIRAAIRNAPKSRESIADEMTELSGETVTTSMINNWTAESHPHELPGRLYATFCTATGDHELLRIQAEAAGLYTLKSPDALRADVMKDIEQKRELDRRIKQKEALIKALEERK
jgi:hypothetical protein